MKKRLLAVLMASALMMSITACSSNTTNTNDTTSDTTADTACSISVILKISIINLSPLNTE